MFLTGCRVYALHPNFFIKRGDIMKKPEVITRAEQWSEYQSNLLELILEELKKMNADNTPAVVVEKAVVEEAVVNTKKKSRTKKTEK